MVLLLYVRVMHRYNVCFVPVSQAIIVGAKKVDNYPNIAVRFSHSHFTLTNGIFQNEQNVNCLNHV